MGLDTFRFLTESTIMGNTYSIITTIAFATAHFFAQLVILSSPEIPKMEIAFIRCTTQATMLVPFLLLYRVPLTIVGKGQMIIVVSCVTGFVNVTSNYLAFGLIPLSIVLTISSTCPIFAILFSRCILKERCKWIDIVASILSLVGVLLIARPEFIFGKYGAKEDVFHKDVSRSTYDLTYYGGCGLALLTAITKALYIVMGRKWSQIYQETRMLLIPNFYVNVAVAILSSFTMLFTGKVMNLPEPLYAKCALFSVGLFTAFGEFTMYIAVKLQNAGVVGILRNLDILYAYFLEYLVLGLSPNMWSVGGAVTIIMSSIVLFFREKLTFDCEREENQKKN